MDIDVLGLVEKGASGILFAIIVGVGWAYRKVVRMEKDHDTIRDTIKESTDSIKKDFNEIREDISSLKASVNYGERVLNEIRGDVNTLKTDVNTLRHDEDDTRRRLNHVMSAISPTSSLSSTAGLVKSHSPISLTDEGRRVAAKINAEEIINKCWNTIKALIKENVNSGSAYDIQQYCLNTSAIFPERFYDEESLMSLKNHAYNAGVQLSVYTEMMGIIIRDRYLKECNIAIEDVDKTDPQKKSDYRSE